MRHLGNNSNKNIDGKPELLSAAAHLNKMIRIGNVLKREEI